MSSVSPEQIRTARSAFAKGDLRATELATTIGAGRRPTERLIAVMLDRGEIVRRVRHERPGQRGAPCVVYGRPAARGAQ